MPYWEFVEFVEMLDKRVLSVWATPRARQALSEIPTKELYYTISLGGTQPLHDCMVKVQRYWAHIWHDSEKQPPIRLEERALHVKIDIMRRKYGKTKLTVECPYEFVGTRGSLILVRNHATEPCELMGIVAVPREVMPLIWVFNSPYMLRRFDPFNWLPSFLRDHVTPPAPQGPALDELIVHGPIFGAIEPIWDPALAEVVWEGLAKRDGITAEQARDRYPFLSVVSTCPWDEELV